jgi:granule-bound starch synthase
VVVLGQGDPWLERCVRQLDVAWPGRAAGYAAFNEQLSHLMMAGCDFLLVPSRYEPCGLVALAALRYATLPIVAPVGGLLDVVHPSAPQSEPHSAQLSACSPPGAAGAEGGEGRGSGEAGCAPERHGLGYLLPPMGTTGDALALRSAVEGLVAGMRLAAADHGSPSFLAMRERCMAQDVSWASSAAAWEAALLTLLK